MPKKKSRNKEKEEIQENEDGAVRASPLDRTDAYQLFSFRSEPLIASSDTNVFESSAVAVKQLNARNSKTPHVLGDASPKIKAHSSLESSFFLRKINTGYGALFSKKSDSFQVEPSYNTLCRSPMGSNDLQIHVFIFKLVVGTEMTRKKCFADFFSSTTEISAEIDDYEKKLFLKLMLKDLNLIRARMLLGHSVEESQKSYLERTLAYIKENLPASQKETSVEDYIQLIAAGRTVVENGGDVKFPYDDDLKQIGLSYYRGILQEDYDFFEHIFVSTHTMLLEKKESPEEIPEWFYQLMLAHDDSQEHVSLMHHHFKRLLKEGKFIFHDNFRAVGQALFLLARHISVNFSKNKEELFSIYEDLLYSRLGRKILCAAKENLEEWIGLLEKEQIELLVEKIIQSTEFPEAYTLSSFISSEFIRVLQKHMSLQHEKLLLERLLLLRSPYIDMGICENERFMAILKENCQIALHKSKIQDCFLLETVIQGDEMVRAFMSSKQLYILAEVSVEKLMGYPILTSEEVKSSHNIQLGINIDICKEKWLNTYKKLWSFITQHWQPKDEDLPKITHIWNEWKKAMTGRLQNSDDAEAYDAQFYTLEKLPKEIGIVFKAKKIRKLYQNHIKEMSAYYEDMCAYRQEHKLKLEQPLLNLSGYESFMDVIHALSVRKRITLTENDISNCAIDLSLWFSKIYFSFHCNATRRYDKGREVLYIKKEYSDQFLTLLLENEIMQEKSPSLRFLSTKFSLNKELTKTAIRTLIQSIIMPEESLDVTQSATTSFLRKYT